MLAGIDAALLFFFSKEVEKKYIYPFICLKIAGIRRNQIKEDLLFSQNDAAVNAVSHRS